MKNDEIVDITYSIKEDMPVYPGNPPVEIEERPSETSQHSRLCFGSHTGTHVDAPKHVFEEGIGVDRMEMSKMVGECKVIDATDAEECVKIEQLKGYDVQRNDKIIVKTQNTKRGLDEFYDDFIYLDGDAADWLADQQIDLFGIDFLSVKQRGGDDYRPHDSLLSEEIAIVEGLNLKGVEAGTYKLVCLPLKLKDGDGAPARCILINN